MKKNKFKNVRTHHLLARVIERSRWTEGQHGEKIFNFSKWIRVTEDLNLGSTKYPNYEVLEIKWEPIQNTDENPFARFGRF